jgi:hypothetical protein
MVTTHRSRPYVTGSGSAWQRSDLLFCSSTAPLADGCLMDRPNINVSSRDPSVGSRTGYSTHSFTVITCDCSFAKTAHVLLSVCLRVWSLFNDYHLQTLLNVELLFTATWKGWERKRQRSVFRLYPSSRLKLRSKIKETQSECPVFWPRFELGRNCSIL